MKCFNKDLDKNLKKKLTITNDVDYDIYIRNVKVFKYPNETDPYRVKLIPDNFKKSNKYIKTYDIPLLIPNSNFIKKSFVDDDKLLTVFVKKSSNSVPLKIIQPEPIFKNAKKGSHLKKRIFAETFETNPKNKTLTRNNIKTNHPTRVHRYHNEKQKQFKINTRINKKHHNLRHKSNYKSNYTPYYNLNYIPSYLHDYYQYRYMPYYGYMDYNTYLYNLYNFNNAYKYQPFTSYFNFNTENTLPFDISNALLPIANDSNKLSNDSNKLSNDSNNLDDVENFANKSNTLEGYTTIKIRIIEIDEKLIIKLINAKKMQKNTKKRSNINHVLIWTSLILVIIILKLAFTHKC